MAGVPRAKPGELKMQWANTADYGPDLHFFRGEGVPKCDAHLLHSDLCSEKWSVLHDCADPSFVDELEARGYDLSTLKFTISKKAT